MTTTLKTSSLASTMSETTLLLPLSESSSDASTAESWHPQTSEVILSKARRLLYVSHLFNQFSENAWQFCLILFLAAFSNYESLILVCSYGLVSGACVCYFGSSAGRFIDGANRLFVARSFIGMENFCVLLATLFCYILLQHPDLKSVSPPAENTSQRLSGVPTDPLSIFLLIGIHLLGATARILDSGFVVAIERDWIVVMSKYLHSDDDNLDPTEKSKLQKTFLSDTNVAMKQIDLSCKVVAPALAGFFVAIFDEGSKHNHGSDLRGAALLVGLLNGMALVVEYVCTAIVYQKVPPLSTKNPSTRQNSPPITKDDCDKAQSNATNSTDSAKAGCTFRVPNGLSVYAKQPISGAGISLSLLYLNVLTFGGIMTAYLVWRGMRLETIGVWRGVSSAAGLTGTLVYHFLSKQMGQVDSGMWSVVFQFLCLSLSYASLFVEDYNVSTAMLIAGVCASRVGLWVFDISVTQLMQEHIPHDVRGLVGGVQESLNAFFGLLSFALGIVLPDPRDFYIYVSVGYAAVGLALLSFSVGVFTKRNQFQDFGERT